MKQPINRNDFVNRRLPRSMKNATMCALLLLSASFFAGCFESDSDGDGIADSDDNCPEVENPLQADHDISGGIDGGNECDEDDDNDGMLDSEDSCPLGDLGWNSTMIEHDFDSDGCRDSTEDTDDDNDGVSDSQDNCHYVSNPGQSNHDADAVGDECDDDDDNDGTLDSEDDCPTGNVGWIPSEINDYDSDGCNNSEDLDDDNDGVEDVNDEFPLDPTESSDFDGDGIGDNADPDDDNDGVDDADDEFPADPSEWADADGDGIGDTADTDDDNDGCEDVDDDFPFDETECSDFDSDGVGDNEDTDDDGDGVPDYLDSCPLSFDTTVFDDAFGVMVHYGIGLTILFASSDVDGDGVALLDEDWDGDGCFVWEDTDDDGDGLHDGIIAGLEEWWLYTPGDNCVIVVNQDQADYDGDGKGDLCDEDIDGDGVENALDWYDYGNGMVSFSFTNFSVWNQGNYDSGGGLPDVYPYIGVGSWDGTQCNDMTYNENYLNYVEEDAYQLDNWITIYWDVPDDISTVCFSLTMYDEDAWALDDILDFVPGGNNGMWGFFNPYYNYTQYYQFDNRGENYLSISLEFEVYTWVE